MDSLKDLNAGNHDTGGLNSHDQVQPCAQRVERRMLLEQLAMAVLAAGLLLTIL